MPAIEIFEEFIPKLDPIFFAGIRKLILLDNDYHKDKKVTAAARYVPIQGTKSANILSRAFFEPSRRGKTKPDVSYMAFVMLPGS